MDKKIYVKVTRYRNNDGDLMYQIKTYKNRPKWYTYIVWA